MVPCGPSPLPEHLWPWREETGAERVPEKSSRWSGGSRHVWSHLPDKLVCAQRWGHTQDVASPAPHPCHRSDGLTAGRKTNFLKRNLLPLNHRG